MTLTSLATRIHKFVAAKTTPLQDTSSNEDKRTCLHGLRGILALCSIFAVFFQTFVPALVWKDVDAAPYQNVLRIMFSPFLWDESLICSFFLVLSGHSIALRFLGNPLPHAFAGSVVRRVIRMMLAVGLASGIASAVFSGIGVQHVESFKEALSNENIVAPRMPENGLVAMNAIFNIFWAVRDYYSQAANSFWPTQTLWNLSLIFSQSWTTYFLMVILPYTRPGWHFEALALFALGSFWMCSWGWYHAAALLLADYTTNPRLRARLDEGLTLRRQWDYKLPYPVAAGAMVIAGFGMKLTWAALPQFRAKELVLHPHLHLSEKVNTENFAASNPYPRVDNFLVVIGILTLTETSVLLKRGLSSKLLVMLGRRSLSECLTFQRPPEQSH